jgi:Xaa-Pro dipeptidase
MVEADLAQTYMRENGIDAWLVYDFRGSNPVLWQLLGAPQPTTRRSFLLIPARGEGQILGHSIDRDLFGDAGLPLQTYVSWTQMQEYLRAALQGYHKVAMEYSPLGALPTLSWVDGGTLEMVRSFGVEVVSSAALFQVALTTWSAAGLDSHLSACRHVEQIKDAAFDYIRQGLQAQASPTEYEVQEFIVQEFERRNLDMDHRPIVGVNANSSNPHYDPQARGSVSIRLGDWVLIDLWARHPGEQNVFGDITWVACASATVSSQHQRIFDIVREARDRVVERLRLGWEREEKLQGWELDVVGRECIEQAGYGDYIVHRTGHSLGPGPRVHALGVNLDNLETHDTRQVLPGTGFSVEPGIYLPEFGVRLEINVYMDPEKGPVVTTPAQREIVRLA